MSLAATFRNFGWSRHDRDYESEGGSNLHAALMLVVLGIAIVLAVCVDVWQKINMTKIFLFLLAIALFIVLGLARGIT